MQNLDVISLNIWDIAISLANLIVLFLILKKFLFAPVKRVMAEREAAISEKYAKAEAAKSEAEADLAAWNEKMAAADDEADAIIKKATARANQKEEQIIAEAKERAEGMIRDAEKETALERRRAEAGIKQEIVDVSALLTEKLIGRELDTSDHRDIINSVIAEIGTTPEE